MIVWSAPSMVCAVTPAERVGSLWVVDQGLKPGDQVIAEGLQMVREGMVVAMRPFAFAPGVPSGGGGAGAASKGSEKIPKG